uniref:hypothetical protein n=1 Tax=Prevotella sp. TaxID=59823 RepID=UPI003FF132F4
MIIICIIKKLSHNTQLYQLGIVTFFSEPSPSPTKNKNLDYKILYKTFLPFFLHDSDNNRKFAADKIRKLMKEKRYTLPEEQKDAAFAAEPAPAYHGNAAIALPEDECAEEDFDWNKIPVGWHPANEEEAVARIEAIEEEYERTGISYSVEEFFNKLNEERTWLK